MKLNYPWTKIHLSTDRNVLRDELKNLNEKNHTINRLIVHGYVVRICVNCEEMVIFNVNI